MSNQKTILFPLFKHILPSDFESWLEQMAAEGWQIDRIGQWSSIILHFRQGEPKKYRFVYDPQLSPRKDYIPTYEEFGWEYLGRMASAHIWRMEYEGERPQAFSDQVDLVERNQRNLTAVSISFFIFLAAVLAIGMGLSLAADSLSAGDRVQLIIAAVFFGLISLALAYVMLQMRKRIQK
ncbi:MAG TPA: DUF2812 domain-containing protein [Anaerolineaceae bacterium]|nr:DUF2812 domain-containing protein [Anaerolineaceae bacterium]